MVGRSGYSQFYNGTATYRETLLYFKLDQALKGFKVSKKKKGSIWVDPKTGEQRCHPNDPNCDTRSEAELMAEIKAMIDRGGIPGEGDDMKPVQGDGTTGRGGKVLGSELVSQPAQDSQAQPSGGGRIVTDLEKEGNPGAGTD